MASLVVDCAAAAPVYAQTSTRTPTATRTPTGTPVACSAADIIAKEGVTCPNNATPCTITKAYVIPNSCVLDFGARAVTLGSGGALDINSGSVILRGGSLTIASNALIDGRGNGTSPATTEGGKISIQTTGDVNVKSGAIRGRIDVSANDQAGTIEILAGGTVTLEGRLNADGSTSAGSGGAITIRAGKDVIVPAGSMISGTGGSLGVGGADMDFGAGGNIDIGEVLDVSGTDAGSVTLTAGNQVLIRQSQAPATIRAVGSGDGAVGGFITITAGTSAQILGNMALQGGVSAAGAGSGDGGTADIEADYGDLTLAANITASGASPDGPGGEVDLAAHGAINIQSGTIDASCPFSQGPGGLVTIQADLSLTSSGSIDASGGSGGGEVDIDAGSFIIVNGTIDASGDAAGSPGGTVSAESGESGNGTFTVNNTIDVTGGPCAQGSPCGTGGTLGLTGCNVTIAPVAGGFTTLKAGAPTGGEIDLIAREQLTVTGKVDAATTIGSGTNGRNVFQYPKRIPPKRPNITANVVTPAAMLSERDTCTDLSQANCLIPCPTCGNGRVEFPETCDDGNTLNCDGCTALCQAVNCDDERVCTIDSCDPQLGCRHVPAPTPCIEPPTATRTITPTATITPTPTNTATITPTRISTPTRTPTATRSGTRTATPTLTPLATRTVTPTATLSPTRTVTPTGSQPPTATSTRTPTVTPTLNASPTATATATPTPTPIEGIPGDGNCDGRLSAADFTVIVMMQGRAPDPSCPLADANSDGIVDAADLEFATLLEFFVFQQ